MRNKTIENVVEEIKEFQDYAKSFGFKELNSAINRFEIISENDEYSICYSGSNEMQISFKKYSRNHVTLCYILTWYEAELIRDMNEIAKSKPAYLDEFLLIKKKLAETMVGFFYYREGR